MNRTREIGGKNRDGAGVTDLGRRGEVSLGGEGDVFRPAIVVVLVQIEAKDRTYER